MPPPLLLLLHLMQEVLQLLVRRQVCRVPLPSEQQVCWGRLPG
jgi:hypothetical protein